MQTHDPSVTIYMDFNHQSLYVLVSLKLINKHAVLTILFLSKDTTRWTILYRHVCLGHEYSLILAENL